MSIARRRGTSSTVLLLAGVALSAFLGALNRFIHGDRRLHRHVPQHPLDDGIHGCRQLHATSSSRCVPIGGGVCRDRHAAARAGPRQHRRRRRRVAQASTSEGRSAVALVSASLLTGSAVSLGGPIPFVGIIVPHIVRLIVGADHRLGSCRRRIFGGAFLVICDVVVARRRSARRGMPVGAITALLGGPFFLMAAVSAAPTDGVQDRHDVAKSWLVRLASTACLGKAVVSSIWRVRVFAAVIAVLLASAAPRAAASRVISIHTPRPPEMLFAMGAGDRLVAVGSYDRFPPEVDRLPRVGALLDPNVERILALRPGPGDSVRHPGGTCDSSSSAARAVLPVTSTAAWPSIADHPLAGRSCRRRSGRQRRSPIASSGSWRTSARAPGTARIRRRCSSSGASRARSQKHRRQRRPRFPARHGRSRRRRERLAGRETAIGHASALNSCWRGAPEVIIELRYARRHHRSSGLARVGRACPRYPR